MRNGKTRTQSTQPPTPPPPPTQPLKDSTTHPALLRAHHAHPSQRREPLDRLSGHGPHEAVLVIARVAQQRQQLANLRNQNVCRHLGDRRGGWEWDGMGWDGMGLVLGMGLMLPNHSKYEPNHNPQYSTSHSTVIDLAHGHARLHCTCACTQEKIKIKNKKRFSCDRTTDRIL